MPRYTTLSPSLNMNFSDEAFLGGNWLAGTKWTFGYVGHNAPYLTGWQTETPEGAEF